MLLLSSLLPCPDGKEYKMIAPGVDVLEAASFATECFDKGLIPVFEACGIEVTRSNESEMIAYCENLKQMTVHRRFSKSSDNQKNETLCIQNNSSCIIKLQNLNEEFASTNIMDKEK